MARGFDRIRKALHRKPRYVLARLARELVRQGRRPWSRIRPRLLTDRVLLRGMHADSLGDLWERQAATPFFVEAGREASRRSFLETCPGADRDIVLAAEAVLRHEFDLLGSGPMALGDPLPWHVDFKTGRRWPLRYCHDLDPNELDLPSDVKVPWELSRCQHFTTLGQAYWLTADERFAHEFTAEVNNWIDDNPFARGINWACPMDVALRAISWIWGFHFFARSRACASDVFRSRFLRSLFLHGEFVAGNLEVDEVNGNHYLVDGAGLVFLGLFFETTQGGTRWLERGRRILIEQMQAQVHEDGVDIEQSIAYHRLVLETFLTAGLLLAGRLWEESFWLLGPSAVPAFEKVPARAVALASQSFPAGGFYVLRNTRAHVIVDCGEVGLRGLGGHGHNDILSFELHLDGLNIVTDCGAYLYTASREWRHRFRSTASHNTVQVDGEELNRLLHPDELFRLRYDAVPTEVQWSPKGDWLRLRAGHRGYERLPAPITHVRTICSTTRSHASGARPSRGRRRPRADVAIPSRPGDSGRGPSQRRATLRGRPRRLVHPPEGTAGPGLPARARLGLSPLRDQGREHRCPSGKPGPTCRSKCPARSRASLPTPLGGRGLSPRSSILRRDRQQILGKDRGAARLTGFSPDPDAQKPANRLPRNPAAEALRTRYDRRVLEAIDPLEADGPQKLRQAFASERLLVGPVGVANASPEGRFAVGRVDDPASARAENPGDIVAESGELALGQMFDDVPRRRRSPSPRRDLGRTAIGRRASRREWRGIAPPQPAPGNCRHP